VAACESLGIPYPLAFALLIGTIALGFLGEVSRSVSRLMARPAGAPSRYGTERTAARMGGTEMR